MNTTKKHFKKNHVLFFPCILLKLASIKKKKCHLLPSKTFCWDTSPPKNTQKFLPPTLPRPTLLPGSLPLPPYGLSNRVPRTQFPRPNELPGKDLPRMNFPTKNAAKPPKKHNKNSKIHGFVRQNFSDFFFRNFHNVSKEILHDKKLLQRIRNSYLPRWSNFPQFVRPKLFRWSQGKDGFEQHRRQSRFQPNLLIPKFMLGFCGSKISGTFFGHQGFSSIHQKKHKKKSLQQILGFRTLISMLGTRLARTSISCSTSAAFGPASTAGLVNLLPKTASITPRCQKIPHGIVWRTGSLRKAEDDSDKGRHRWKWFLMVFGGVSLLC